MKAKGEVPLGVGMAVDRGKAGTRPNPPRLDRGWTIRIGRWTYTGIPV